MTTRAGNEELTTYKRHCIRYTIRGIERWTDDDRKVYGLSKAGVSCSGGAKLVMPSTAGIPDRFELLFKSSRWSPENVPCSLVEVGIEFINEA